MLVFKIKDLANKKHGPRVASERLMVQPLSWTGVYDSCRLCLKAGCRECQSRHLFKIDMNAQWSRLVSKKRALLPAGSLVS